MVFATAVASLLLGASAAPDLDADLNALAVAFPLGVTPQEAEVTIDEHCPSVERLDYAGKMAEPYKFQTQINCAGYEFFGAPRRVEFYFNEGTLGFYWILLEEKDLLPVRTALSKHFGEADCACDNDAIYTEENIALRRDPPEILVAVRDDLIGITGGCPDM